MGLPAPLINFFLKENQYMPISGNLLTLGRQTILCSPQNLAKKLKQFNIRWDLASATLDRTTTQALSSKECYIDDNSFFGSFGKINLNVLDITNYEGATIIHDMSLPVPNELKNKYDFIFNGSILDNMFDPAQAMRNITEMLSSNGRVLHIEMASNLAFEYVIFSVDWFLDYYVVNDFLDCTVYVCEFKDVDSLCRGPWRIFYYNPKADGTAFSLKSLNLTQAVVVVIAEKKPESTSNKSAVQWCYRNDELKKNFVAKLQRMKRTRPIYNFSSNKNMDQKMCENEGFLDCGVITAEK